MTVDPRDIHQRLPHGPRTAAVSVQVFHLPLSSPQNVRLNVGTYSTDPPSGVSLVYDPASQVLTIPAGPSGRVTATVTVGHPSSGGRPRATVTIFATLTRPSTGIRIGISPPGNWRATLNIENP